LDQVSIGGTGIIQVSSINFNIYTGTGTVHVGLYNDNGGAPQSLLGSGTVSTNTGWNQVSLSPLYLPAGTNYWIAVSPSGTATDPGAVGSGSYSTYAGNASALPAVLGVVPYTSTGVISGYTLAAQLQYCQ
jgi:hypothetical protein